MTAGRVVEDGVLRVPSRGVTGLVAIEGDAPEWMTELVASASVDRTGADATFPAVEVQRTPAPLSRERIASEPAVHVRRPALAAGDPAPSRDRLVLRRSLRGGVEPLPPSSTTCARRSWK